MRWLLALWALTACGTRPAVGPFSLRIALVGPLQPLGAQQTETSSSAMANAWVFEPLAVFDDRGQLVPRLATRIERLGAHRIRVQLGPATFSDGAPLTEADVVRSLAASGLRAVRVGAFLEIEAVDNRLPIESALEHAAISRVADGVEVGTGPFAVVSETPEEIVLARRAPLAGRINEVVVVGYPTERETLVRTLRGDADVLRVTEPRLLEFFEGVPRLKVLRAPGPSVHALGFNSRRLDQKERLALVHALRTGPISEIAYGPGCAPVPPASYAPLPPGRKLGVMVGQESDLKLALAIRRALGTRGGEVRNVEPAAYFAALKAGDFDLALGRPLTWPPMAAATNWRSGAATNVLDYASPLVDAAIDRADWPGVERALAADPPAAFFCTQQRLAVVDARVVEAGLGPLSFFETLPEWRVAP